MMSSDATELLSQVEAELDAASQRLETEALGLPEIPPHNPEYSEWWNFQHLVSFCVLFFYSETLRHSRPSTYQLWSIGEKVLEKNYRPFRGGGTAGAFLDFQEDAERYREIISTTLTRGLADEDAKTRESSIINAWITSLSWSEKICIAAFFKDDGLNRKGVPLLSLPEHKLALQLDSLIILWRSLCSLSQKNFFETGEHR